MEGIFFISFYEGQTWNRFEDLLHSLGMSDGKINTGEVCYLMTEAKRDRSILNLIQILEASVSLGSRLVVQRYHVGHTENFSWARHICPFGSGRARFWLLRDMQF